MANLVDKIQDIINNIDLNIDVVSTDGTIILVCDTKWITELKFVKDELGNEYKVTSFVENTSVTVTPGTGSPALFSGDILVAPEITYFHGSPASVNAEYNRLRQKTSRKTPFIWLVEPYESDDIGLLSPFTDNWKPILYFMEWLKGDDNNDKQNNLAIKPMEALGDAFEDAVNIDFTIKRTTFRDKRRPRFGIDLTNRGSNEKIIDEDLSGIEKRFDLSLFKTSDCKC